MLAASYEARFDAQRRLLDEEDDLLLVQRLQAIHLEPAPALEDGEIREPEAAPPAALHSTTNKSTLRRRRQRAAAKARVQQQTAKKRTKGPNAAQTKRRLKKIWGKKRQITHRWPSRAHIVLVPRKRMKPMKITSRAYDPKTVQANRGTRWKSSSAPWH